MATHLFIAFSNPVPGREDEYNTWYDNVHVPEVNAIPGYISGQRFKLVANTTGEMPGQYLVIYEMETKDPIAAYDGITKAMESGKMIVSNALHAESLVAALFKPIIDKYVPKK